MEFIMDWLDAGGEDTTGWLARVVASPLERDKWKLEGRMKVATDLDIRELREPIERALEDIKRHLQERRDWYRQD